MGGSQTSQTPTLKGGTTLGAAPTPERGIQGEEGGPTEGTPISRILVQVVTLTNSTQIRGANTQANGFGKKAMLAAGVGALAGMAVGYGIGRFARAHFGFRSPMEEQNYNRYMYERYGAKCYSAKCYGAKCYGAKSTDQED